MSKKKQKIVFFGHFGKGNLGNESTLKAALHHVRLLYPAADIGCICTGPDTVAIDYGISTIISRPRVFESWAPRTRLAGFFRKLTFGIPAELYRWFKGFKALWGTNALIVPGTGLLTDAYTLFDWGPYDMFRWSLTAKLCGCKLLFVSVGAGPIYGRAAKLFVKAALSMADFRSYRDASTANYLERIGFSTNRDRVYPDLAFSMPLTVARRLRSRASNPVVGIGLMEGAGRYGIEDPSDAGRSTYLHSLIGFAKWLLANNYDVRLLIGDFADRSVTREFKTLLDHSLEIGNNRVIEEPINSVDDLLTQIEATDFVVATRFHNVLLSLILNKPLLAVSFHHKCSSLMDQMGVSAYCQDINTLTSQGLIESFHHLQQASDPIKRTLKERVATCETALNKQYSTICKKVGCIPEQPLSTSATLPHAPTSDVIF